MAVTKAKINRVGLGRLVIYTKNQKYNTVRIDCSRNEIGGYLKHYEWTCFDWNGKKFRFSEPWKNIILN